MKHTPYGYDIVDGKVVVNEEQADIIRKISDNYLSGMSLMKAAAYAGRTMRHSGVKNLLLNPRYSGDEYYPQILTAETVQKIKDELEKREKERGYERRKGNDAPEGIVYTKFSSRKTGLKYTDPVRQAEYAYGRIKNEHGTEC